MIHFINNRILTLIETLLLITFAVLMFTIGDTIFNILFGVALIVYTVLFVLTKVVAYRGMIQLIAILEFFAMTTLAIFVIVDMSFLPEGNMVNMSVGLAMWFRATTEILHSYLGQGQGRAAKKQFNAWKLFAYILLVSFGTYVATNTVANDKLIRYFIAGISTAAAVMMAVLTYTNFRDPRTLHPKAVKVTSNSGKSDSNVIPSKIDENVKLHTEEIPALAEPQTEIEVVVEPNGNENK